MRFVMRVAIFSILFLGLAWASGVRLNLEAVLGLFKSKKVDAQDLMMKDGKIITGRILGDSGDAITVEIEKGVELDLPKIEIERIEKSSSSLVVSGNSDPLISYSKKQNYFLTAYNEIARAFNIMTYDPYTPEERKQHAQRLSAGYEWHLGGGRERAEQMMDMAARKSLGPYAKYMKNGASKNLPPES